MKPNLTRRKGRIAFQHQMYRAHAFLPQKSPPKALRGVSGPTPLLGAGHCPCLLILTSPEFFPWRYSPTVPYSLFPRPPACLPEKGGLSCTQPWSQAARNSPDSQRAWTPPHEGDCGRNHPALTQPKDASEKVVTQKPPRQSSSLTPPDWEPHRRSERTQTASREEYPPLLPGRHLLAQPGSWQAGRAWLPMKMTEGT